MQNIEIKTPLHHREDAVARLGALGARKMWTRRQVDTFFEVPNPSGWLKLRESEGRPLELISYERSTGESGPRPSEYDVAIVQDVQLWKRLLGRVLQVDAVVEKERTLWVYEHTRIHLDRVEGLGDYLELETVVEDLPAEKAIEENRRVVMALSLDPSEFLSLPYKELLRRP